LLAAVVVVSATAAAGCDLVTADFKSKETAQWHKTYELQPGGRIEIQNVNGRIDVEPAQGNTVDVTAEKTARGATPEAAKQALQRIEIVEDASPSSVKIETKVQRSGGIFDHSGGEVRYTVRVPAGAEVRFSTVNGGIELAGLSGRIQAETTNGGIKARDVSGQIDASTTNGGVEVELARISDGGAKLGCTNGGIKLRLPADVKADISASIVNGGITTNGLQLETTESTRRRLEARLNGGGPRIALEGTNGGIRIESR
jgi:DUF4097 and DUF4098 domain-containing protein YvlB